MKPPKVEELIERADRRAVYINQVKHAKEAFRARNVLFWEGHPFDLTQQFLSYVCLQYMNWTSAEDKDPVIILDRNDEPVLIEDMDQFVAELEDIHAQALNAYHDIYSRLQLAQSAEELIEVG